MNFSTILFAAFPVFLIVAVGFCCRRFSVISDESEKSIMRLTVNVLYPCFILSRVPGNESLQQLDIVVAAVSVGFFLTVTALALTSIVGRMANIDQSSVSTFSVATALQNYGFIPIPLIESLFGEAANETLGVLFVHNLGLELAMWTIAIIMLSGSSKGAWRKLINGPTIAIVVGLTLNFSGTYTLIPDFANEAIRMLGQCSIPIGLILAGATLASVVERESWNFDRRIMALSVSMRFLLLPCVFLAAASLVSFSPELRNVLIVESAMPSAIFPIVLAKHFGGKASVAALICVTTTIASIVMMPLILLLSLRWFGIELAG